MHMLKHMSEGGKGNIQIYGTSYRHMFPNMHYTNVNSNSYVTDGSTEPTGRKRGQQKETGGTTPDSHPEEVPGVIEEHVHLEEGGKTDTPSAEAQKEVGSLRYQFGGKDEEGVPLLQRMCFLEEDRDFEVNMGLGQLRAPDNFQSSRMETVLHTGAPQYDLNTQVLPKLPTARHYGDKQYAAFKEELFSDEIQELILLTTYYSRYVNEALKMETQLFPDEENMEIKMGESVKMMEDMKKSLTEAISKMRIRGKELDAQMFQMVMDNMIQNHEMQVLLFQQQTAGARNVRRLLEPMARMLTTMRNILVKLPSNIRLAEDKKSGDTASHSEVTSKEESYREFGRDSASQFRRQRESRRDIASQDTSQKVERKIPLWSRSKSTDKSQGKRDEERDIVPKVISLCTKEEIVQFKELAVSLGRDQSRGAVDPFDIAQRCPRGLKLPPLSASLRQRMDEDQIKLFEQQISLHTMEQAFLLLEARYLMDCNAWNLGVEWPKVSPPGYVWDLWRFAAVDCTVGGVGRALWEQEKVEQVTIMINRWLETEEMMYPVYLLIRCLQQMLQNEDLSSLANIKFIYTGLDHEFWSVGWTKQRVTHKLNQYWKFPNLAGELIKNKVLRSVESYLAYSKEMQRVDPSTGRGEQWRKMGEALGSHEKIWFISEDWQLKEAKVRLPPRVTSSTERHTAEFFITTTNRQLENGKIEPLAGSSPIFYPYGRERQRRYGNQEWGEWGEPRYGGRTEGRRDRSESRGRVAPVASQSSSSEYSEYLYTSKDSVSGNVQSQFPTMSIDKDNVSGSMQIHQTPQVPQPSSLSSLSMQSQQQGFQGFQVPTNVSTNVPVNVPTNVQYPVMPYPQQMSSYQYAYAQPAQLQSHQIFQPPQQQPQQVPVAATQGVVEHGTQQPQPLQSNIQSTAAGMAVGGMGRGRGMVIDRSRTSSRGSDDRHRSQSRGRESRRHSPTRHGRSTSRRGREDKGIFQSVLPPHVAEGVEKVDLQGQEGFSSEPTGVEEYHKEAISPTAMSVREEGECTPVRSPHSPSYTPPESMNISPVSPQEVQKTIIPSSSSSASMMRQVATRGELRGCGIFSRYWMNYTSVIHQTSRRFKDFDIFRLNQKFPMSSDESHRLAEYRKQTSKGAVNTPVAPAFTVPIQSRLQMREDVWTEYLDINLPSCKGVLFRPPPDSIANAYRMRASPRIIDWKTKPGRIVSAMGGGGGRKNGMSTLVLP